MDPQQYCREKIYQPGTALYYSLRFDSQETRQDAINLHAWLAELTELSNNVSDPGVARTKLDWWQAEIQEALNGSARHPVSQALADTITRHQLETQPFLSIARGFDQYLRFTEYATPEDLDQHCRDTLGNIAWLWSAINGCNDNDTREQFARLGTAIGHAELLRDTAMHVGHGRVHIARSDLEHASVGRNDFLSRENNPDIKKLFSRIVKEARERLDTAYEAIRKQDRANQPGLLVQARLINLTLQEMNSPDFNPLRQRVSLTPIRMLWTAWKTTLIA